jgi:tetratricopeptide (TPR) repeat protein
MLFRSIVFTLCAAVVAVVANAQSAGADQYFAAGQRALASGNYQEAERNFEKARAADPSVAEIHANLGLVFFQEGLFDRASEESREALRLKPTLPQPQSLLAMSLSELGKFREALPELQKCFSKSAEAPGKRMCGLELERAYTGLQRNGDAVQVALELQRLYPADPEILYHNEKTYGNYAFQTIQQLMQVAPNSLWRHQAAAEAYESQGSFDLAIEEYREVLKLDPNRPGVHYRIGRTLLTRSRDTHAPADSTDASKEFEQELQLDPRNANAAYELAEMYRESNDLEKATQYFEIALTHYPDFEDAHVGLAAVLTAKQQPQLAVDHLKKAVALKADDEVAWYRLSLAERMIGNIAGQKSAMAQFQRLRSATPPSRQEQSSTEVTKQSLDH